MADKSLATKQTDLAREDAQGGVMGVVQRISGVTMIPNVDKGFRFRYPRMGKIRLGAEKPERGPGRELAYFRLPQELLDDEKFMAVLAKYNDNPSQPTRLPIWLPFPSIAANLSRSRDLWNTAGVLKCRSCDGVTCQRLDDKTGTYVTGDCKGNSCKDARYCRWIHRLVVILPDAKGSGVWQIDTPSPNNWATLLTELAALMQQTRGHIAGIDLMLTREPRSFQNVEKNDSGARVSTQDHYMLHIRHDMTPRELLRAAENAVVIDPSEVEGGACADESYDPDEFPVGEEPAETSMEQDDTPTDAEALLAEIRQLAREAQWSPIRFLNVTKAFFGQNITPENLDYAQLTDLYNHICKIVAAQAR